MATNPRIPSHQDPIKPGETREVRIPIERTPADWNRQMPSINVQDVASIGRK